MCKACKACMHVCERDVYTCVIAGALGTLWETRSGGRLNEKNRTIRENGRFSITSWPSRAYRYMKIKVGIHSLSTYFINLLNNFFHEI